MKQLFLIISLISACISHITTAQTITTVAGGGSGGSGSLATAAHVSWPVGVRFDRNGNMYIAEGEANRIRKVNAATGIIVDFAGTGVRGFGGDGGPASAAKLDRPEFLAFDKNDNLYVSEAGCRVRKIELTTGIITTYAGNGTPGNSGDGGPATAAKIYDGYIWFDADNNLYLSNYASLRKIDTFGIISTIAGDGTVGRTLDGVSATSAHIATTIEGLVMDSKENIYFGDRSSVRKITKTTNIITRFAGIGDSVCSSYTDLVPATSTYVLPLGLACDFDDNIYIVSNCIAAIRMVDTFGIIHSFAGNDTPGFRGDGGPATAAKIYYPEHITFDYCGNLYLSDFGNQRVRKIAIPSSPRIILSGTTASPLGSTVTVRARVGNAGGYPVIKWKKNGVVFATTTTPWITFTKSANIDSITAMVYGCNDSASSALHRVVVGTSYTPLEKVSSMEVNISPNPARDQIEISGSELLLVKIVDLLGRVMQVTPLQDGRNLISIGTLPQGNYIVEVSNKTGARKVHHLIKD